MTWTTLLKAPVRDEVADTPDAGGSTAVEQKTSTTATEAVTGTTTEPTPSKLSVAEENQTFIQTKSWQSADDIIRDYRALEQKMGVPPDRLLRLNEDGSINAEDKTKLGIDDLSVRLTKDGHIHPDDRSKIGVPQDKDGYELGDNFDSSNEWYKNVAHELGLTKQQAEELYTKYTENDPLLKIQQQYQEDYTQWIDSMSTEQVEALTKAARGGAQALNLDEATLTQLEFALGGRGMMQFLTQIGEKVKGAKFVDDANAPKPFGKDKARIELDNLKADKSFVERLMKGDKAATEHWQKIVNEAVGG